MNPFSKVWGWLGVAVVFLMGLAGVHYSGRQAGKSAEVARQRKITIDVQDEVIENAFEAKVTAENVNALSDDEFINSVRETDKAQ